MQNENDLAAYLTSLRTAVGGQSSFHTEPLIPPLITDQCFVGFKHAFEKYTCNS